MSMLYRVEAGFELRQALISYQADRVSLLYRVEAGPYFVPGLTHHVAYPAGLAAVDPQPGRAPPSCASCPLPCAHKRTPCQLAAHRQGLEPTLSALLV